MDTSFRDTVQSNDSPRMTAIKAVLDMVSSSHWDSEFVDEIAHDAAEDAGVDEQEVRAEMTKITHQLFETVREMMLRQHVTERLIHCHRMSHEVGGLRQTFASADERRIADLMVKATLAQSVTFKANPRINQYWLTNEGYEILNGTPNNLPNDPEAHTFAYE